MSRPVHFEILAADPEKLSAFYADVFGWEISSFGGPQAYWFARTGAAGTPGIDGGFMHGHFPQPVIHTLQVDDIEAVRAKVEAAGGELVHGPEEIPDVGLHAYFKDPAGIIFGTMQPAATAG